MTSSTVPLTIELFPGGGEAEFEISSMREIHFILLDLARHGERVALYFERRQQIFMSYVLDVDKDGFWLDAAQTDGENQAILNSHDLILVSVHHQAKVQFEAEDLELVSYLGSDAFYVPFPANLYRIQRREYFRLHLPSGVLKCQVSFPAELEYEPAREREVEVRDLSQGGIALHCEENDQDFQVGAVLEHCTMTLNEQMTLEFALQVRNVVVTQLHSGSSRACAGCRFVNPSNRMSLQLQRYITQQQKLSLLQPS